MSTVPAEDPPTASVKARSLSVPLRMNLFPTITSKAVFAGIITLYNKYAVEAPAFSMIKLIFLGVSVLLAAIIEVIRAYPSPDTSASLYTSVGEAEFVERFG